MKINVEIEGYKHPNTKIDFFSNLSFVISLNGFYLLTGISGIGKSTLMKIMLGIYDGKLKGNVIYIKKNINYSGLELRKKGVIGYHSDDFSLIPWKTIEENIRLPKKLNKNLLEFNSSELAIELDKLGLTVDILKNYPHQLSYGMKARIGILRACIYNPKILFLDELFSGVDSFNNKLIIKYLESKKKSSIIIGISHQIERAIDICDKIIVINKGKEISVHKSKSIEFIINQLI